MYLTFQFVVDQFQKDLETALRLSAADLAPDFGLVLGHPNFNSTLLIAGEGMNHDYLALFHSNADGNHTEMLTAETLNRQVDRLHFNF